MSKQQVDTPRAGSWAETNKKFDWFPLTKDKKLPCERGIVFKTVSCEEGRELIKLFHGIPMH